MASELSRTTRDRVAKAELAFGAARRAATAVAANAELADAVAVRENAQAHLAELKTALLEAEAYEAET